MQQLKKFFARYGHLLFWPIVATLIFIPAFGKYSVFPSPDSAPVYAATFSIGRFREILAEAPTIALYDILQIILPPLFFHDFSYWLHTVLIALGFYLFMRERGLPKLPALFGGGALAFAGYSFSLIFAGHRAYFIMGVYVAFTFFFLARAIRRESLLSYLVAACTASWAFRFGPDMAPQFLVVAALYALWLFATNAAGKPVKERTKPFITGCVAALVAFALVAAPSIYHTCTTTLKWRQNQIEQSSGTALTAAADSGTVVSGENKDDVAAREKWIFATNWSLPPEEVIEFVAPAVFGTWTGDRTLPYWGRLGRSEGWDAAHPNQGGFFNFRQHIVYLGAIPVGLMIFAVAFYISRRLRREKSDVSVFVSDIPFWFAVGIVALLLAFGRYAPFYRFFYAIPYMSFLRAPVKFMRLVEFATAALAASGLGLLLAEAATEKLRRGFGFAMLAASAGLVIYALHVNASFQTFAAILGKLGAPQLLKPAAVHAIHALWHGILGFALVGAVAFAMAKRRTSAGVAGAVLLVALAVDVAVATKPFTVTTDVRAVYEPNCVTKTILNEAPSPKLPTVTILGLQQTPDWFAWNLAVAGIRRQPFDGINHNEFLGASEGDIAAMCELTGSTHLILPVQLARSVDRAKFEHVLFFNMTGAGLSETKNISQNSLELLRVKKCLPYASIYSEWKSSPEDQWMKDLAARRGSSVLTVGKEEPCSGVSGTLSAEVKVRRGESKIGNTVVETQGDVEAMLLVLDPLFTMFAAKVDGAPADIIPSGYAKYVGIRLAPGRHTVVIGKPVHIFFPVYSTIVILVFIAGCIVLIRREGAEMTVLAK